MLSDQDLRDLAFFGVEAAVAVAGDDAPDGVGRDHIDYLERLVRDETARLRQAGIAPFVAVGVHPRRIPSQGFAEVLARLPGLFDLGPVVAIGSIGLASGGPREEAVFQAQLELAVSLDLPVIVHLPEQEKLRIVRRSLTLLMESEASPSRILVTGVDEASLRLVRSCGFTACLLVHPSRIAAERAVQIVRQHGAQGLVLASDAGSGPGDLLSLPRTLHLLEQAGISSKIARRITRDNAISFFGIDRQVLPGAWR